MWVNDEYKSSDINISDQNSILWIPETHTVPRLHCVSFLILQNGSFNDDLIKEEFSEWCNNSIQGEVRCFLSGDDIQVWGFTNSDDIIRWIIKWT